MSRFYNQIHLLMGGDFDYCGGDLTCIQHLTYDRQWFNKTSLLGEFLIVFFSFIFEIIFQKYLEQALVNGVNKYTNSN
jgi:hypothetical protein